MLFIRGGLPDPCNRDLVINGWKTSPPLADQASPSRWSACASTGMPAGTRRSRSTVEGDAPSTNFFPLLPLLMAIVSRGLGGDVNLAGRVINGVAFILKLTGLWQLVRHDFDTETADRMVLYLAVFPTAFFFFAPFTEALFLVSAVWALLGARRGNWKLAAFAGLALHRRWPDLRSGAARLTWRDLLPPIAAAARWLRSPPSSASRSWPSTGPISMLTPPGAASRCTLRGSR